MNDSQIVIVGSGLAGLTSAAYLSREGYPVLLIEKNEQTGGLINSFEHEGFVFDVGARSIENSGVIKPLLKDLEIEMELLKSSVSIGIESDIFHFEELNDIKKYKELLVKKFPENKKDIENIFEEIDKITKSMAIIYGFDNPVFTKDFTKNKEYILKELLPWFRKFIFAIRRMNKMNKPINPFLEKYTANQSLIDMISQHFFTNTSTFFALGYFYVYQDYLYPKGGTGVLTQKLKEKILENGGKIINNTFISSINPSNKTIGDRNNNTYNYSKLIWAANLKDLYSIMDLSSIDNKLKQRILKKKEQYFKSRGGDSVFSLYLGVDKPLSYFSKISNGHFFYTPQKRGLKEINKSELKDIIKNFEKYSKEDIFKWIDRFCMYNTYEISIPGLRDSLLVPEGKTGLIVSVLFEYDLVKKIKEAHFYDLFKKEVERKMIEVLQSSVYHELKDNICFKFSFSPLSYEKKVNTCDGAITGWTYERQSPVVSEIKKIPKSVKTPIDDIFKVGQWAYCPAGIPTAILTGWYAYDTINKDLKLKK